jgi:hypothetical protein
VELEPDGTDQTRVRLAPPPAYQAAGSLQQPAPDHLRLVAEGVRVEVDLEPFQLMFYGADGRRLLAQDPRPTDVTDRLAAPTF